MLGTCLNLQNINVISQAIFDMLCGNIETVKVNIIILYMGV